MRAAILALAAATLLACHSSTSHESSDDAGCDQLAQEVFSALAPAEAEQSCTKDSDCVFASNDTACFAQCGVVVNQAGAAALDAAIAQLNATICVGYRDAGCGGGPPPCHPTAGPSCVDGQCVGLPALDADDDAGFTCNEETGEAQTAVNGAVAEASTSCDATADCVLVSTATVCTSDCSRALVNQGSAAHLQQAIAQISATDCPDFLDGGCPSLITPCPPSGAFACVAGSCVFGSSFDFDAGDGSTDAASE